MNPTAATRHSQTLVIAGAGIVGLSLALAVKQGAGRALEVQVADPAWEGPASTGRATAIAAGPRRMFETLGVWRPISAKAQPILSMHVSDSRASDVVRPVYLRFDGEVEPGEPFAHMVENDDLIGALKMECLQAGVNFIASRVTRLPHSAAGFCASFENKTNINAALVVAADGAKSRLRARMRMPIICRPYPLAAIIATFGHENAHEGRAEERFLEHGPLALLPLTGNRCSIVWTVRRDDAQRMVAISGEAFAAEVQQCAGFQLGRLQLLDQPRALPLALMLARHFTAPRFALVGDAAHTIHPLAGQGLNLGLRDSAALAEEICDQVRLGLDIGDPALLRRYERARRFDSLAMVAATDALDFLFRADATPLRLLRDLGMGLVDRLPPLKTALIREAAALGMGAGRLFKGEAP